MAALSLGVVLLKSTALMVSGSPVDDCVVTTTITKLFPTSITTVEEIKMILCHLYLSQHSADKLQSMLQSIRIFITTDGKCIQYNIKVCNNECG